MFSKPVSVVSAYLFEVESNLGFACVRFSNPGVRVHQVIKRSESWQHRDVFLETSLLLLPSRGRGGAKFLRNHLHLLGDNLCDFPSFATSHCEPFIFLCLDCKHSCCVSQLPTVTDDTHRTIKMSATVMSASHKPDGLWWRQEGKLPQTEPRNVWPFQDWQKISTVQVTKTTPYDWFIKMHKLFIFSIASKILSFMYKEGLP